MKSITGWRFWRGVAMASAVVVVPCGVRQATAQQPATIAPRTTIGTSKIEDVRRLLTGLAADSMEGRGTGTIGSVKASVLIANEFRKIGLEPTGANASFFQEMPYVRVAVDSSSTITVNGERLTLWTDFSPPTSAVARTIRGDIPIVYGGLSNDSSFVPAAAAISGKIVLVLSPPAGAGAARGADPAGRGAGRGGAGRGGVAAPGRFAGAIAIAVLSADALSGRALAAATAMRPNPPLPAMTITVSRKAAELLLGAAPETLQPGAAGRVAGMNIIYQITTPTPTRNVAGIIRGGDPALRDEFILVDAHYDHLGIGRAVNGDSIFNGADDDASGSVAVMEIARALKQGPPPKRSIIFIATTGEERGLIGTNYFIANPLIPLTQIVANLEIEMIGRPDSLAGGSGKAWLTGYERSSMGPTLAAAGIPVILDPRPAQNFFRRSDNIAFAQMGIVAHTLSSFNLHTDYHQVSDDVDKVDFQHMTAIINAAIRSVDILANGPRQTWNPGGQPTTGRGGSPMRIH